MSLDFSEYAEVRRPVLGRSAVQRITARAARSRRLLRLVAVVVTVVVAAVGVAGAVAMRSAAPAPTGPAAGATTSGTPVERPVESGSVEGTWIVEAVFDDAGGSVPLRSTRPARLVFAGGRMLGDTGCNDISSSYEQRGAAGTDLVFGDIRSTLVGCADEPPLASRLADVRHATTRGDGTLSLGGEDGKDIVDLRPAEPEESVSADVTPDEDQVRRATVLAEQQLAKHDDATITSATLTVSIGTVASSSSNTGTACSSGMLLNIKLIGSFPGIAVAPPPILPDSPPRDDTVAALLVTADAVSGRACLIGVQTRENGEPTPEPDATVLDLR
ncbi:MAG: META domain-containing protein [Nocardioides sp.]|uniref:META domain-containing protein n=1 Tax=Nocardioides sp. TaxID=35761 RepID=UPI0039E6F303